jgi:hypothetical protein
MMESILKFDEIKRDFDTVFKENKINVTDTVLTSLQECLDSKLYGDLL